MKGEVVDQNAEVKKIAEQIEKISLDVAKLNEQLSDKSSAFNGLRREMEQLEAEIKEKDAELAMLFERQIVRLGVPADLLAERAELEEKIQLAARKDITIARRESLEEEIAALKLRLQKDCGHTLVLQLKDGYKGSYTHDYDDRYCGERVCVVCGFKESEASPDEGDYKVLCYKASRLIKHDQRKQPVATSLKDALKMFYRSAGRLNAAWNDVDVTCNPRLSFKLRHGDHQ